MPDQYSVVGTPGAGSYAAPLLDFQKMLGLGQAQGQQQGQLQPRPGAPAPGAPMNILPAAAGGGVAQGSPMGAPTGAGLPQPGSIAPGAAPAAGAQLGALAGSPQGGPMGMPAQQGLAARLQAMFGNGQGMAGWGNFAGGRLGAPQQYQPNGPAPMMRNDVNGQPIGGPGDVGFGKLY